MERTGKIGPVIECCNVGKIFATKKTSLEVLRDLSLQVWENEFVVLLGPGQCGKTTLMNMIAGTEPTEIGQILFNGEPITKPNSRLGVVYQTTGLFPWYTVRKNVDFGPRMKHMPKDERQKKTQYYIDLVGLTGFEDAYPNQLSGGMQQRVGIARAYCNDPEVMLMDEPFGHLDAQTRYSMQEAVQDIWSKEKRTVLFITNNIEEAVFLADRVIVLTNTPTKVKEEVTVDLPRPRSNTSRDFLKIREYLNEIFESTK